MGVSEAEKMMNNNPRVDWIMFGSQAEQSGMAN